MKNRIKELRQGHGVTQAALAKYLGVAQNTLSYWEQGKYDIDNASLQKIADFFNCSVDCILCRSEVKRNNPTEDLIGEFLSDYEKQIILAFRKQPEMQEGVCRLLGVEYILPKVDQTKKPSSSISNDICSSVEKGEATSVVTNTNTK